MNTPELDKMLKAHKDSRIIREFLEWLLSNGYTICIQADYEFLSTCRGIEDWLANYFQIDMDEAERERQAIVDELRQRN